MKTWISLSSICVPSFLNAGSPAGAELCAQLTDKARNGNRTPEQLLEHVKTEPLVLWSFTPGVRPNGEERTPPPLRHSAFVDVFKAWIAEGTPCPADPTSVANNFIRNELSQRTR